MAALLLAIALVLAALGVLVLAVWVTPLGAALLALAIAGALVWLATLGSHDRTVSAAERRLRGERP